MLSHGVSHKDDGIDDKSQRKCDDQGIQHGIVTSWFVRSAWVAISATRHDCGR
jgi:hypothetical protein